MKKTPLTSWFIIVVCLVTILLAYPATPARGTAGYYVSSTGNDANPGTLVQPFRTIQKCAEVAVAGDTCYIRAGVYRETVRPANSGANGAPITFKPYNGERVVISGADLLTGPWALHSGAIYRTAMPWNVHVRTIAEAADNQIWVDGVMLPEARWPNIPIDRTTRLTNQDKAKANSATISDESAATYHDSDLSVFSDNFWAGGKITFGPGYGSIHTTCDVTASTSASVSFQCNPDPAANGERSKWNDTMLRPSAGNYYYLWGKLEALDSPGEWFRASDGTLYLWLPQNRNPSQHTIEAKRRLWAFDLNDRSHITLDGLHIFGASIRTNTQSHNLVLQNLEVRFPWHVQRLPPLFWTSATPGIDLRGNDNVLRDSLLAHSAGRMVSVSGLRNVVANNVIYDAGYMAGDVAVNGQAWRQINPGGTDSNIFRQNTVFNTGRFAVQADPGLNIFYNDLYNSHLQISDLGTIYSWGTDGKGAQIAYNWVHDNWAELDLSLNYFGGHGIYLDDDTYNYFIYRNIVWNTTSPGIFTFGVNGTVVTHQTGAPANRFIYNNTVDGEIKSAAKSNHNGRPQYLTGTVYVNNIGTILSLDHPQLTTRRNFQGDAVYIDRFQRNYALRAYSPAVDAGENLGSPFMDAPMQPVNAPDQGALENGRVPWVAGALLRTQDTATLRVTCQPQASGVTQCMVNNLPIGRKLPLDFAIRIGDGVSTSCTNRTDYTTHTTTGECIINTTGLTDIQPVAIRLGNEPWQTVTSVDLRPLDLETISPWWSFTGGGAQLALRGWRFATGETGYSRPISVTNTTSAPLYNYPVLITLDTAALIANGKLRTDCGDLRFFDEAGLINYWLETGCNTATTRVWVKVPYIPVGTRTIHVTYGNAFRASASNGSGTFLFFDDFQDGAISPFWNILNSPFATITETGGQLRLVGQTTTANQYAIVSFALNTWMLGSLPDVAIDSELSIVTGPDGFKAGLGTMLNLQGSAAGGKNIAFWQSGWHTVGKSTITSGVFNRRTFSIGLTGSPARTLHWREDGQLNTVLATTNTSTPTLGFFSYGPDTVAAFDVRFDNIRIRPFAFPEPQATVGPEQVIGVRVLIGDTPCLNIVPVDATLLYCTAPPHAPGWVDVTVINPDGERDTLVEGLWYGNQPPPGVYLLYVPALQR
ncbi:DUF2341 domain-containing protein [Chloroflexus sp.]|uniref:DUF2341 domain-containing protein n=1 Tax=Chloroflexus sp. TaxID=1904827 RepID=UPI00298F0E0D|nr:DUF2341 domain-containing protein [Chloroflexus sp.]MDW8404793.1 DUF2341 domain-containing protein [Chloroflexus sp.]